MGRQSYNLIMRIVSMVVVVCFVFTSAPALPTGWPAQKAFALQVPLASNDSKKGKLIERAIELGEDKNWVQGQGAGINGEDGFDTKFVDEAGNIFEDLDKAMEPGNDKDKFLQELSNGTLIKEGLEILKNIYPNYKIDTMADVSRIDERTCAFDIALLPFLETVPSVILSRQDWGLYTITADGIVYILKGKKEFVPFNARGRQIFPLLVKDVCDQYFLRGVDSFTQLRLWYAIDLRDNRPKESKQVINRGFSMISEVVGANKNQIITFCVNNEVEEIVKVLNGGDKDGAKKILSLWPICVVFGLLEKIPDMLVSSTAGPEGAVNFIKRRQWYWIPYEDGIEFVNRMTNEREFVRYASNLSAQAQSEIVFIKEIFMGLRLSAANNLVNILDDRALSNEREMLTGYDKLRILIKEKLGDTVPLAYDTIDIYRSALELTRLGLNEIGSSRFTEKNCHFFIRQWRYCPHI